MGAANLITTFAPVTVLKASLMNKLCLIVCPKTHKRWFIYYGGETVYRRCVYCFLFACLYKHKTIYDRKYNNFQSKI